MIFINNYSLENIKISVRINQDDESILSLFNESGLGDNISQSVLTNILNSTVGVIVAKEIDTGKIIGMISAYPRSEKSCWLCEFIIIKNKRNLQVANLLFREACKYVCQLGYRAVFCIAKNKSILNSYKYWGIIPIFYGECFIPHVGLNLESDLNILFPIKVKSKDFNYEIIINNKNYNTTLNYEYIVDNRMNIELWDNLMFNLNTGHLLYQSFSLLFHPYLITDKFIDWSISLFDYNPVALVKKSNNYAHFLTRQGVNIVIKKIKTKSYIEMNHNKNSKLLRLTYKNNSNNILRASELTKNYISYNIDVLDYKHKFSVFDKKRVLLSL